MSKHWTDDADADLVRGLKNALYLRSYVRLCLGDPATGRDWGEDLDVTGFLGLSGDLLILLPNSRSSGGTVVHSESIVKLMVRGTTIWQHPTYNRPTYTIGQPPARIGNVDMAADGYTSGVYADGENVANFKSLKRADRFVAFMEGRRMNR